MTENENRRSARGQPLSVLVPVHNFGSGIKQFLDSWRKPIEDMTQNNAEILVIDDASTDSTKCVIESYSAKHPNVKLVLHEAQRGLGAALQAGINASLSPNVLVLWPNWAFQPSDLGPMLDALKGADVVAAFRPGLNRPKWLQVCGTVLRVLSRWVFGMDFGSSAAWYGWANFIERFRYRAMFGLRLQDPTCGARLLRRSVLERCTVQSTGTFALVELYAKANFIGALFHEVQLKRAGTIPVLSDPAANKTGDQKRVFRSPVFCSIQQGQIS